MDTELKETLGEQSLKEMDFAIMKELADRLAATERQRDELLAVSESLLAFLVDVLHRDLKMPHEQIEDHAKVIVARDAIARARSGGSGGDDA